MQQAAIIDIFTTHNDLYGGHNCPIQFCCEFVTDDDMNNNETTNGFMSPSVRKVFNIIPDEPIMMGGYVTSGFRTEDTMSSDYGGHDLKTSLTAIYKILTAVKKRKIFLVGYNHVCHDLKSLNENISRVLGEEPVEFSNDRTIDIMKFSESVIPVDRIGNFSIESVFTYVEQNCIRLNNLRINKSTATEIRLTKMIMLGLLRLLGKKMSFSDIVGFIDESERNQDIFTFGKYKGLKYSDVFKLDIGYLTWIVGNREIVKMNPHLVENIGKLLAEGA